MSNLDVEALLDATAKGSQDKPKSPPADLTRRKTPDLFDRDERDGRLIDPDRRRVRRDGSTHRSTPDVGTPRSDTGSQKSRRRSRSRDDDRRGGRRRRDGDYYRGGRGRRSRSRSRSPNRYRPRDDKDRRDRRDRDHRDRDYGRRDDRRDSRTDAPQATEDERDRRTVFVQQLAARLRTRELKEFFEKVGPVNEAQIVKDRISQRSKGFVTPILFMRLIANVIQCWICRVSERRIRDAGSPTYRAEASRYPRHCSSDGS